MARISLRRISLRPFPLPLALALFVVAMAAIAANAEPTAPPPPTQQPAQQPAQLDLGGPTPDDPPLDLGNDGPPPVEVPADADAPGEAQPGNLVTDGVDDGIAAPPVQQQAPQDAQQQAPQDGPQGAVDSQFYEPLSPYGSWGYYDDVGWAFRPRVAAGWEPYTVGHWGADGLWLSDEPFGWACFHYGRWAFFDGGWVWVPGSVWAPSWVVWSNYGGYVGWAPVMAYGYYAPRYVFVDRNNFYSRHIDRVAVPAVVHHGGGGAATHHAPAGISSSARTRPSGFNRGAAPAPHNFARPMGSSFGRTGPHSASRGSGSMAPHASSSSHASSSPHASSRSGGHSASRGGHR